MPFSFLHYDFYPKFVRCLNGRPGDAAFWITYGEKDEENYTQTVCRAAHGWDSVTLLQKGIFTLWKERIGRGKHFRRFRNVKLQERACLLRHVCLSAHM
jgi:hypothetical protein